MFTTFELAPLATRTDNIVPVVIDCFIAPDGEVYTRERAGRNALAESAAYLDTCATGTRHLTRVIGERDLGTGEDTIWSQR